MGIVIGCIMLSGSLADAYAAAQGTVEVTTLHIFGLGVDLVGFQGGIIVALLMGLVTAKLDIFFERKVPEVIRLLVSPLLTTLVSSFLLFLLIGPIGRGLASGIALADPAHHGYMNYVIAHVVAFGTGFLIHIGINTVNLNGKYFDVQAAVGDQVKMGDILVTEDIEKIKAEGYDMSVMIIATDANGRKIEKESPGKIKKGEKIAELV